MKRLKGFVFFFTLALFLIACSTRQNGENKENSAPGSPETTNSAPSATPVDDIAEGKKHYAANCARCHKDDGTGGPVEIEGRRLKPEDLTSAKMAKEPDEEYIEYMESGIPDEGMPSFKEILTKEQMDQVVKYIRKELQKKQ
ncbi:MAG: cytochrome c [Acidobacteriota bacterium]|nr:cytochrome c [Acidobacteriota bacterium]MDH3529719.1 cytochrome c [Acidobacteriota bacterium]